MTGQGEQKDLKCTSVRQKFRISENNIYSFVRGTSLI